MWEAFSCDLIPGVTLPIIELESDSAGGFPHRRLVHARIDLVTKGENFEITLQVLGTEAELEVKDIVFMGAVCVHCCTGAPSAPEKGVFPVKSLDFDVSPRFTFSSCELRQEACSGWAEL